ncbi:RNA dependent RNA polymerase-domain-containing protein [Pisolithus croceorrhizus]|nr:RNA dependent RNA polymerase-domain-containing protein [Pisolithus croceorrhizus]KAI6111907.1 RNA dependent RNA polymerase-domain-containing protein [Pisolithus croceorrhizus]
MEFSISNVHTRATAYTVTKAIADQVLHRRPGLFLAGSEQRLPNFSVTLNPDGRGGVRNDGTGTLTLTAAIGERFLELYNQGNITVTVNGGQLRFHPSGRTVDASLEMQLERAPFIDPGIEQERQRRILMFQDRFCVSKVQIGTFYRPSNAGLRDPRAFSIEWEMDLTRRSMAWLKFEYDHRLMRIEMGDPATESLRHDIVVKFHSISKMALGCEFGEHFICFDLVTPPMFQKEEMHRPEDRNYNTRYRHRVGELCPGHGAVALYAHHLRIVLRDDVDRYGRDVLRNFRSFCVEAGIRPLIRDVQIVASREEFFHTSNLLSLRRWLGGLGENWRVAFQIEALLNNGTAHTRDVLELRPRIDQLINRHGRIAGEIMRYFTEAAANRPTVQPLQECFEAILRRQHRRRPLTVPDGRIFCHHVTFTPTQILLEGPNVIQSNRVIREYQGYEDYFLRVSFRDEGHLQYRWTRDVDGETFLRERVGGVLREGFCLAGRRFAFLAYSSSALRSHTVWFVSPFQHPTEGLVTAESIRASLGNFEGVINSPSRYGARMAQAFTATDSSVRLHQSQWSEMSDIEQNGIVFTDGVGTISQGLATLIWHTLHESDSGNAANAVQPSAYQIRFLGYKGMVVVDPLLEGIHMCLRPSMKKFDVRGRDYAEIEIASAFGKPKPASLNRPLVMVLEDRGVSIQAFLELQEQAVSNTRRADESLPMFVDLLEKHKLCKDFWVPDILRRLNSLGFESNPNQMQLPLNTPFLLRLRSYAINHVLRNIKYRARIPIPESYMLPGVADEGPAYANGRNNVYCLPEPTWLSGPCTISRSPVMHPGDVQCVEAIGRPPTNCLFANLRNVVVFPAQGTRSLPNSLAGGDLDGDIYEVVQYRPLLNLRPQEPATYPPARPFTLNRPSTVNDVCDFIVDYIYSDVVGLVSDKHITIAGKYYFSRPAKARVVNMTTIRSIKSKSTQPRLRQRLTTIKDGTLDPACLRLAELHSQAVDYPKNGRKVRIHDLPRALVPFKPDWHQTEQPEQSRNLRADYYLSSRALGYMYRNIELEQLPDGSHPGTGPGRNEAISNGLRGLIQNELQGYRPSTNQSWEDIASVYAGYQQELVYISTTYSLSKAALSEEELVIGTILANFTNGGYKKDRVYAMKESLSFLLRATREALVGELSEGQTEEIRGQLARAWKAWTYTLDTQRASTGSGNSQSGSHSFGLIALGLVLECLARMGSLAP